MKVANFPFLAMSLLFRSQMVLGQQEEVSQSHAQVMETTNIPNDASSIWGDIKGDTRCLGCQGILGLLKTLAIFGDGIFVGALQELCKAASVTSADDDVCNGVIALEGPVIADSLRQTNIGSRTSQMLCASLMGLCNFPTVTPYTVPVPPTRTNISQPEVRVNETKSQKHIRIAHFSDIHVDPFYTTGANTNCTKPMCCRPYTPSDEPGNNDFPAGPFGDHNCGAPLSLEDSMYAAIQNLDPDFAIFTGDIVDHAIWNTTVDQNAFEISSAYQHMADAGMELVYGTVGNHEQSPANAIPPTHLNTASVQWLYDLVSSAWSRWIGSQPEIKTFGAYSVKYPEGNLRVISFSTNMYYTLNFWLYQNIRKDPSDQLAWLVSELDKAERAGERVYLVGHMPMGSSDSVYDGSNYFDQIVNRYQNTIAAMFFGHTHLDHFQLSYSDYENRRHDNAVAMSYISPSMTPLSGMPAFRIYTVDAKTFGIVDVETYYANMNDSGFQNGPVWGKYYSARDVYGPLVQPPLSPSSELSPAFWHNVTVVLESDGNAFKDYWAKRTRGWNVQLCNDQCQELEICQLRAARSENNCFVPTPGGGLGIRAEGDPQSNSIKCDRSVVTETFESFANSKSQIELLEKLVKREMSQRA